MNLRSHALLLATVITLSSVPSTALAQAWIAAPGDGYVELSFRQISGGAFYDDEGESRDLASTYTQRSVGLYAQAGIIERWLQLTAEGELYRVNELEDQGRTAGLGDIRLGAWTGLLQGDHNLSLGLQLGVPTGDPNPGEGIEDNDARNIANVLPTGDGNLDITPSLAYGLGFGGDWWPLYHYLSASAGYVLRTDGAADAFEYRTELGIMAPYPVIRRVWFVFALSGLEPIGEPRDAGFAGLGDGVTYTGIAFGANVSIWRGLGVLFRLESAVRAQNIIAAGPLKVGLFWDF